MPAKWLAASGLSLARPEPDPVSESDLFFGPDEYLLHGRFAPAAAPGAPVVVLAHGHPRFGGSMDYPIVKTLRNGFHRAGLATLRFNFRGVGQSRGKFNNGIGELDDLHAAITAALDAAGARHVLVAAYSFGAWVAVVEAKRDPRVRHIFAVAPPNRLFPFHFIENSAVRFHFVCGTADAFCDRMELRDMMPADATVQVVQAADHFFQLQGPRLFEAAVKAAENLLHETAAVRPAE